MKTPTLRLQSRPRHIDTAPLRLRAELPALRPAPCALRPAQAAHDFLVPNPRPDLTLDALTLRMIEAG
jgi:hypothetical protein